MSNSHRVGLAGRVILQVCTDCSLQLVELHQVLLQQGLRYQVSPLNLGAVEVQRERERAENEILHHCNRGDSSYPSTEKSSLLGGSLAWLTHRIPLGAMAVVFLVIKYGTVLPSLAGSTCP